MIAVWPSFRSLLHRTLLVLPFLQLDSSFAQTSARLARSKIGGPKARLTASAFDSAGIESISCEGVVDWDTLLKGQMNASFREQVLPVLRGTHFLIVLNRNGAIGMSTQFTVDPVSPQARSRAQESIRNFGGVLAMLLHGWARFGLSGDLPPSTQIVSLDGEDDHFFATFKEGSAEVGVALDRSFVLLPETSVVAETAPVAMPVRVRLAAASNSLHATSWSVRLPGPTANGLDVEARYMDVDGIEVPAELALRSRLPDFGELTLPLALSNYQFVR